jgi:hypothetical protein
MKIEREREPKKEGKGKGRPEVKARNGGRESEVGLKEK